jgi:hypothetical protein
VNVFKVDLDAAQAALEQIKRSDESILKCWVWGTDGEEWRDCRGLVELKARLKAEGQATNRRLSSANQSAMLFKEKVGDTSKTCGLEGWSANYINALAEDTVRRALYYKYYKLKENASTFQAMLHKRRVRTRVSLLWLLTAHDLTCVGHRCAERANGGARRERARRSGAVLRRERPELA